MPNFHILGVNNNY